eukprot:scaffold18655_cov61-Phaeocystis_antarctica.AAC.5
MAERVPCVPSLRSCRSAMPPTGNPANWEPRLLGLRHRRGVAPHEGRHREPRIDQPRERVLRQPAACAQLLQLVHRGLVHRATTEGRRGG